MRERKRELGVSEGEKKSWELVKERKRELGVRERKRELGVSEGKKKRAGS